MTELAVYQASGTAVTIPDPHDTDSWITVVQDIIKIANVIFDTPFVPDGLRGSAPAVAAAMLAGREMGLGIMTSLANIDVIKGRPAQKALLMRAMIQSRGHRWQDGDVSDVRAVVRACRKGESEWAEVTFTAAQARLAGIDLGKYPADKLYARATSRMARRKFADVIMGMPYSAEETEDGYDGDEQAIDTPAIESPKPAAPRTAQRRQARPAGGPDPTPVSAAASATASGTTPQAAPARTARPTRTSAGLPPLPGEEEATEPDAPAADSGRTEMATGGQVGIIQSHFARLGFDEGADREERLNYTAALAGTDRDLSSTKDLTQAEARTVADALSRCRDKERLILLVANGEKPASDG